MFLTVIAYVRSTFMITPPVFILKLTDTKALSKKQKQLNIVTVTHQRQRSCR